MLTLPSSVRVYLALDPVSMHLSFDRLAGLVRGLGLDPTGGHLFVFVNRPKTHMKVLFFDRSGFCQLYKRLEQGTFQRGPSAEPGGARATDRRSCTRRCRWLAVGSTTNERRGKRLTRSPERARIA